MSKAQTDFDSFQNHFKAEKSQIVHQWISADLETPVSAYLKICGHAPYSFLFESVEGGTTLGRYSIIGTNPDYFWRCSHSQVETKTDNSTWMKEHTDAKSSLKSAIASSTLDIIPDNLPPMCALGLFGYIGYDMVRLAEDIPDNNPDDLNIPDSALIRPSLLVIFDNVKNMMCIATPVYENQGNTRLPAEIVFNGAKSRIDKAITNLQSPLDRTLLDHKTALSAEQDVQSNTPENQYKAAVEKAVQYIHEGETFQTVLSQRFSIDFDLPPFELYRSLRSVNPSPFLFHLSFEDFALVGSSPEILVRVRDDIATIRPIAGTRKRGLNAAEDEANKQDLLADPKERAEHLMLLDLGRNDIGRIAEIGSVNVTEQFEVEFYSHVMHIISNVEGKLREDVDIIDALFAGFPAGTVSGAPKIRAMEIIDELEISRRGTYAGGIGYFSDKSMDSCIALRTALVKDNKVYVQAGGGIVADSNADFEHQECQNKARAVLHAAELTIKKFN